MDECESKALEAGAVFYNALPAYLLGTMSKDDINHILIDLIDSLDIVEFSRTGEPFFNLINGDVTGVRKRAILEIERKYDLTERESSILRYLANDRNPTYIANALGIAQSTAKAHKYSIYKKLGIHTAAELKALLQDEHERLNDQPQRDSSPSEAED